MADHDDRVDPAAAPGPAAGADPQLPPELPELPAAAPGDADDQLDGQPAEEAPAAEAAPAGLRGAALSSWAKSKRNDWGAIKRDYVEGMADPDNEGGKMYPSYPDLAKKWGVSEHAVRNHGADEGWVEARAAFQTHIERVRLQKRAEAGAKELQDLDAGALRVAKTGVAITQARLAQIADLVAEARKAGEKARIVDARELNQLAQAADLFHRIGLRSLGDPEGTIKHELTGAGGGPVQIEAELRRDDPARLTGVLHVLRIAGLGDVFGTSDDAAALLAAPAAQVGGGDGGRPALEVGRTVDAEVLE